LRRECGGGNGSLGGRAPSPVPAEQRSAISFRRPSVKVVGGYFSGATCERSESPQTVCFCNLLDRGFLPFESAGLSIENTCKANPNIKKIQPRRTRLGESVLTTAKFLPWEQERSKSLIPMKNSPFGPIASIACGGLPTHIAASPLCPWVYTRKPVEVAWNA
jgi:hypothetical protein